MGISRKPEPNLKLREERLRRRWTQQELADRLEVTVVTVNRWEKQGTLPGPRFRFKLCTLFNKSSEQLGFTSYNDVEQDENNDEVTHNTTYFCDPALPFTSDKKQTLVGRQKLIDELIGLICNGGTAYAITGLPGVGKTALVTTLAQHPHIQRNFKDGILWVGLGRQPRILELMSRWGRVLGLNELETGKLTTPDAWAKYVHDYIGMRRMLIIIDDAWELTDASIFRLGGRNCVHLLTTRFPALGVSFAYNNVVRLQELTDEDSHKLLEQLVPEIVPHNVQDIQELIKVVGGLPLALTLIGHYLYLQAYSGQQRRLHSAIDRLRLHATERLNIANPHLVWHHSSTLPVGTPYSLQIAIDISLSSLTEQARQALYALSIFPPKPHSFSEEAATTICAITNETLDQLVDSGLVESSVSSRYLLHQVIADYAALHRADTDISARMAAFFIKLVQDHQYDNDILQNDMQNIVIALELAFDQGIYTLFLQGVLAFAPFLETQSPYPLAHRLLTRSQTVAQALNDNDSGAKIWLYLGKIAERICNFQEAEYAYQQGLILAQQGELQGLVGRFYVYIGGVFIEQGNYSHAEIYVLKGMKIVREQHDKSYEDLVFWYLGEIADSQGKSQQAEGFYQQGLKIAQQLKNYTLAAILLQNLGVKAARKGKYQQADAYYYEGLEIAHRINDRQRQSALLMNQGMLAFHQKQYYKAVELSKESLAIARSIQNQFRISSVLQNLGMLEGALKRYQSAEAYLQESLQIAQEIGHRWLICETLGEWGRLYFVQHKLDAARESYQTMLQEARKLGAQLLLAQGLFGLAQVTAKMGAKERAIAYASESQLLFEHLEDIQSTAVAQWISRTQSPNKYTSQQLSSQE
ncbi:tetratricopeptide repeat protein [Ktedonobacter racemifer]|uniref:Transcriptional regulator, XRE family n=1 Tax=Ktedonobacter racemifer DSM 44963 TaxID=485913 RepID=D6TMN9_KTERA|nr:tetratricopeptide repeat protein [Ktedonobacter racemifer]EFH87039.1 transcriptional regulator, XRE family [Ktedonobacter racemifer DSM 44963]